MEENNNDKSRITSSSNTIIQESKAHFNDFKSHLIIFLFYFSFTLLYTYFYFYKFSQLSINEMVSLNNGISFPFLNLTLSILLINNYNATVLLKYKGLGNYYHISKINKNKTDINIKSELNVSDITLSNEYDYLSISFFCEEKKIDRTMFLDTIFLKNEIYSFNMLGKDYNIKKINRTKYFFIGEELYYYYKRNEPRCYQFYIHSHSIQTFDKTYEFPVIDDHYNIIPTPLDLDMKDLKFSIIFKKKRLLNSIEILGESKKVIFMNTFGTMTAIFEFLLPFFYLLWQIIRLLFRKLTKIKSSNEQNSQNSQNKQISQSQNLIANELSHQNNDTEMKIMSENNIYINNN